MRPIKVLHVVDVEKQNYYLSNLSEFNDRHEIEYFYVTFASEDCDFVKDFEARGWPVHALGALSRRRFPQAFRALWKLTNKIGPEIVHTHLFDPSLIGLTVAKGQGRKTVLTRHHSDAVHEIASLPKRKFYLGLENYISRNADHIIAPSRMVREFLVDRERVAKEKVSLIPYGQTATRFDAVTKERIEAVQRELGMLDSLALVNVSRLYHRKGHKYLFEAFADLLKSGLDATLYLVGEGEYRGVLQEMAANLAIREKVRFLGWRDDALVIMAAADVIVHPSLEDALSSAVIESLILERPIVATDISGVRDSLDNGRYGEIVRPADTNSFKNSLQKTIENLSEARTRAKAGRQYILKYMDARRVAIEYQRVYGALAG